MSVPPRTEREQADWEVSGEQPRISGRHEQPDRLGLVIVSVVLVALAIAVLVLLL
jgi:hypothetical protein